MKILGICCKCGDTQGPWVWKEKKMVLRRMLQKGKRMENKEYREENEELRKIIEKQNQDLEEMKNQMKELYEMIIAMLK